MQFNGANYSNNSRINITDIGEDDSSSLTCITSDITCCQNLILGAWYFPNGSAVRIEDAGDAFYSNRGPSEVRLHRRYNAMTPTGSFCCEVPDANGITQTACVIVEAMATVTVTESDTSTTYLVQLRLFEIQNCLEWVVS